MAEKTDADRIDEIYQLCKGHFDDVRFVGIKYHTQIGWIAKTQFNSDEVGNLTADGKTSTEALRNLRKRIKKIIKRYDRV